MESKPAWCVRVGLLAAPREARGRCGHLDQHRGQQHVVGTARAGRSRRERRTGRAQHVDEVSRHGGRHQPRHHRRQDAAACCGDSSSFCLISTCVRTSPAPDPTTMATSREVQPRLRQGPARRGRGPAAAWRPSEASLGLARRRCRRRSAHRGRAPQSGSGHCSRRRARMARTASSVPRAATSRFPSGLHRGGTTRPPP